VQFIKEFDKDNFHPVKCNSKTTVALLNRKIPGGCKENNRPTWSLVHLPIAILAQLKGQIADFLLAQSLLGRPT